MKPGTIMAALLALTVSGGAFPVQATQSGDPLRRIGEEVLRENCAMAEQQPPDFFRGDAGRGPAMGKAPDQSSAGEMSGPSGTYPLPLRPGTEGFHPHGMKHPGLKTACFMKLLDLTDAQKKQIFSIVLEQKEKTSALLKKRSELQIQLRKAERAPDFNEKTMRAVTAGLADNEADMVVIRVNARNRINAVLTPRQRELVKKMETDVEPGQVPPAGPWFFPESPIY